MEQKTSATVVKSSTLALFGAVATAAMLATTVSPAAYADTTQPPSVILPGATPNQSAAVGPGSEPAFKPGVTVTYFGWYTGPSVTAPGSPYQPTTQGFDDPSNQAGLMNYASVGYKFSSNITLFGVADWFYTPLRGGDYTWSDPFIKLKDSSVWKTSEWNLAADLRVYIPATVTSQNNGLIAGGRLSPNLTYTPSVAKRWTFGLYGYAWGNMYGTYGTGHYFDLYLQPNISYQLTPTVALTGVYELYGHQEIEGLPPFVDTSDPTDFQVGVSWDIAPWLNFNPYIQAYPGSFSWSSTSFGAYIAATVF